MNKKIKMIELLNMISRGELKDKTKFKVYSSCKDESDIPYICEYDKTEPGIIWCITSYDSKFNFKIDYMRILNYYVEILEDNTEEIEELTYYCIGNAKSTDQTKMIDKINELVRAVNSIRKNIDKEYCCCCGVEITDENRAMNDMCNECKYGIDWEEKTK